MFRKIFVLLCIYRFGNIHPYDFNRVKLKTPINGVDYINASYITGDLAKNPANPDQPDDDEVKDDPTNPARWSNINFIATQGPLPETVGHQLELICENKVDIIVMLTRCTEMDKSK